MAIRPHRPLARRLAWPVLAAALALGGVVVPKLMGRESEELLRSLTLEEKVGQLLMAGFPGTVPGAAARRLIEDHHVGGLILFARNIQDAAQVAALNAGLQGLARGSGAGIPLFLAVDQEGGLVVRVGETTPFPGNMALGAAGSAELARKTARSMGRELAALGFNVDFAPVVDVNNNPDNPVIGVRSFGEDPALVGRLGAAMIEGFRAAGILATAKHFPGHGDTHVDSHFDLPVIAHAPERLEQVELAPFRAVIEAGADAVMTAHIVFPRIDPDPGRPATLSRPILQGLLREGLGFDGLVFTDALEMRAISDRYGIGEAAVQAVLAGADVVLVAWPDDPAAAGEAAAALRAAARDGRIPRERIDEAVRRVLEAKAGRGFLDAPPPEPARVRGALRRPEALALAREVARASVTVVRNENGLLPLQVPSSEQVLVVTPTLRALTPVEDPGESASLLGSAVRAHHPRVRELRVPMRPREADIRRVLAEARHSAVTLVGTDRAWHPAHGGQARLVQALVAEGLPVVAIALREPYDLRRYPQAPVFVATYGHTPASLEALAEVLFGQVPARGRLPVSIPGLYPAGHGLSL